jgi:hypothetical protein
MILKFAIFFSTGINGGTMAKSDCGIAGGCFTDVKVRIHSSMNYHHEHALPTATVPHRLHKDVTAACGAVIFVSTEFVNRKSVVL